MKKFHIPITKPCFDSKELASVKKVLESRWLTQGGCVAAFEKAFSDYARVKYALAVSSCTTALHLALIASHIGKGDEVIVPAFTFIATANAVEYTGAKLVFCDISMDNYNVDIKQIEAKITPRTRAIMPVHLFGLLSDMKAIGKIAKKYNLTVIEDAACAVGSKRNSAMAGNFGGFACFSFHPRKIITTGEGGMITFNDSIFKDTLTALRSHGANFSDLIAHTQQKFERPHYDMLGYNYRMTDLQAAIGIEQLKKVELFIKKRNVLAARYNQLLRKIDYLKLPFAPSGYRHAYQSYVIYVDDDSPLTRDEIIVRLSKTGIMAKVGTYAVHLQGYYQHKYGLKPDDFPNAVKADRQCLALPLYHEMGLAEHNHVVKNLRKILGY